MRKISIACDHGALTLKAVVKEHLQKKGYEVADFGTYSADSCDYPDYAAKVGHAVVGGEAELGILVCGTGLGISIAANKIKGVRAAVCGDVYSAKMSREHNNANILALGERVTGVGLAEMIVDAWLAAEFAGGRHARRVDKIMALEAE